ncbi:hypothetical protein M569_02830, partial [Genlisea aurea]
KGGSSSPPKEPSMDSAVLDSVPEEAMTNLKLSSSSDQKAAKHVESGKSSLCRGSTSTSISDESTCSSFSSSMSKPHKSNDLRWEVIQAVRSKDGSLDLRHFRLLKKLGCG